MTFYVFLLCCIRLLEQCVAVDRNKGAEFIGNKFIHSLTHSHTDTHLYWYRWKRVSKEAADVLFFSIGHTAAAVA